MLHGYTYSLHGYTIQIGWAVQWIGRVLPDIVLAWVQL
jgi:hypothetical protein